MPRTVSTGMRRLLSADRRSRFARSHPLVPRLLQICFPLFCVLLAEYTQMQSFSALFRFFVGRPGVLIFDVLMIGLLFIALHMAFKKSWLPAGVLGLFFYLLACVEFFKFDISHSHFYPSDLVLTQQLGNLTGMANIRLTLGLVIGASLLVLYTLALFCTDASLRLKPLYRTGVALFGLTIPLLLLGTGISAPVFHALGIDHRLSNNTFAAVAKFENNNFLSFWCSELSLSLQNQIHTPEGYGKSAVETALRADYTPPSQGESHPNVLIVLSESFGDYRLLDSSLDIDHCYRNFDAAVAAGLSGLTVVPTFGGYTDRSEFELLSGLPLASILTPVVPHKAIARENIGGIPDLFRGLGYDTAYMHPYLRTFYERETAYPVFGLEELLFQEELEIGHRLYRGLPEDSLCFDRAISLLESHENPLFLMCMTLQNHQPYMDPNDPSVDELTYYLQGLEHTDQALGDLIARLDALEEPTVLLFLGDHFPFFGAEGNFYQTKAYDDTTCGPLFVQRYLLWANYPLDGSLIPEEPVSLFYLPHLLLALSNPEALPAVSQALLAHMAQTPIYTDAYSVGQKDPLLDLLTYDRLIGEGYSLQ